MTKEELITRRIFNFENVLLRNNFEIIDEEDDEVILRKGVAKIRLSNKFIQIEIFHNKQEVEEAIEEGKDFKEKKSKYSFKVDQTNWIDYSSETFYINFINETSLNIYIGE